MQHLDKKQRVTVQLISAATGKTMWAEKYDEFFTDIFTVQDEISERLAQTLAPRLSGGDQRILMRRYIPKIRKRSACMPKGESRCIVLFAEAMRKRVSCSSAR